MINNKKAALATLKFLTLPIIIGVFTENPILTVLCCLVLPLAFYLLWTPLEPPVLLFAVFYHWVQIITPIINANIYGEKINKFEGIPEMEYAEYLCIIGLIFFSFGLFYGRGKINSDYYQSVYDKIELISPRSSLKIYAIIFLLSIFLISVMWVQPGLTQLILPLITLHDAFFILIILMAIHDERFKKLAYILSILELMYGFLGFFSNFKTIFFYWIILLATNQKNLKKFINIKFIILVSCLFIFGLIWQTIKSEYRVFMSGNIESQIVVVSIQDRVVYLINAIDKINLIDIIAPGIESLSSRVGATEYVAHTINMVPDKIPFQNGKLWLEAISRVFTPRLFFPDKKLADDSEITRTYTGLDVAGAEEGTSIGIGYFAESYIDFGPVFMFIPIFLIGYIWAKSFRILFLRSRYPLLSLAIAISFIVPAATLVETSNIKLFGGIISYLLVIIPTMNIICFYTWKKLVNRSKY